MYLTDGQEISDNPWMIILAVTEWDNIKPEANWWLRTTADALGFSDVYQLVTGRDFDNGQKIDRVRADANLTTNVVLALTLHKTLKLIPNVETPLEVEMKSNR